MKLGNIYQVGAQILIIKILFHHKKLEVVSFRIKSRNRLYILDFKGKWIIPYVDKISELNIDVEDTAHLILGCLNRKIKNLSIVNLTMDFYRHDRKRECIAIGKKGSLQWDGIKGCIKFLKKGASHWEELYIDKNDIDKSYISQWKYFLKLLENKKRSFNSLNNALKIVEIVELIKKNSLNLKLKKFYRKS